MYPVLALLPPRKLRPLRRLPWSASCIRCYSCSRPRPPRLPRQQLRQRSVYYQQPDAPSLIRVRVGDGLRSYGWGQRFEWWFQQEFRKNESSMFWLFSIAFYQLCNMPEPDAEFSVFRHLTCVFLVLSSVWICHQAYVVVTTVCYLTTVAESFRFPFVSVIRKV